MNVNSKFINDEIVNKRVNSKSGIIKRNLDATAIFSSVKWNQATELRDAYKCISFSLSVVVIL